MSISAVWRRKGSIDLESRQPSSLGPTDIKIRVEASGLCGTDLHIAAGEVPSAQPGVIIGHEFAGTVVELGPEVEGYSVGERVVIDPNIPCHTCYYCRNAQPHLCERPQALGVTRDGGMTEFAVLPAAQAYHVPANLPAAAAALTEPLACALHAVDLANLREGQTAVVLGAGPIGILCTALLVAAGASRVAVSEPNAARRERVRDFGAEPIAPEDVPVGKVDVVLECVGRAETMRAAVDAARPGGTVVWVGVARPDVEVGIKPHDIYQRELTIRGSYTNPFTMERALALLSSGRINWEAIVTNRVPLTRFDEAWDALRTGAGLKVSVQP
jgi:L-iditol 2-dehydrogenase